MRNAESKKGEPDVLFKFAVKQDSQNNLTKTNTGLDSDSIRGQAFEALEKEVSKVIQSKYKGVKLKKDNG